MADFYTQASLEVKCTPEAGAAFIALSEELDAEDISIEGTVTYEYGNLWVRSEESINTYTLATALQTWLKQPGERPPCVGFEYANTCSKPRTNAFGGGAYFVTPYTIEHSDSSSWLRGVGETWLGENSK